MLTQAGFFELEMHAMQVSAEGIMPCALRMSASALQAPLSTQQLLSSVTAVSHAVPVAVLALQDAAASSGDAGKAEEGDYEGDYEGGGNSTSPSPSPSPSPSGRRKLLQVRCA
jgi:hypothetical protein